MIKSVEVKNFKGQTKACALNQKTIVVGHNGTGKTTITQAIQLAVHGSVPGIGKTNPIIYDTFATDLKMAVKIEIDDTTLSRAFNKKKDTVTQVFGINGKKATKEKFIAALHDAGAPVIVDVKGFVDLSADKKMEALLELYPPKGDIAKVENELEAAREDLRAKQRKMKELESMVSRLQTERDSIQLPPGTPAETKAALDKAVADLEETKAEINKLAIAEAEERTKKAMEIAEHNRAQQEALRRQGQMMRDREDEKKAMAAAATTIDTPEKQGVITNIKDPKTADDIPQSRERTIAENTLRARADRMRSQVPDPRESINTIIAAMQKAGCGVCSAVLVAKRELKKYTPTGASHG
jgi:DNA repair exonuclease SbcCD ATPase subunit